MLIPFTCPACGKFMEVGAQYAGQSGPCQACGQTITIPFPDAAKVPLQKKGAGPTQGSSVASVVLLAVGGAAIVLLLICGVLGALLLPAVQAARTAARRAQSQNNMKQIALALQNYHDVHKAFPPAYIPDANGKPMHSWRTLILPYIENANLHRQYDFNKPWDDPANRAIADSLVPVYASAVDLQPGAHTSYVLLVGPGTAFEDANSPNMMKITDGTANTIMLVEVHGRTGSWAEPKDLDLAEFARMLQNSPPYPDGTNAAMFDGSVHFLQRNANLPALSSPAGGEPVVAP